MTFTYLGMTKRTETTGSTATTYTFNQRGNLQLIQSVPASANSTYHTAWDGLRRLAIEGGVRNTFLWDGPDYVGQY